MASRLFSRRSCEVAQYTPRVALRLGNLCLGVCVRERGEGGGGVHVLYIPAKPTNQTKGVFLFFFAKCLCFAGWCARVCVCV